MSVARLRSVEDVDLEMGLEPMGRIILEAGDIQSVNIEISQEIGYEVARSLVWIFFKQEKKKRLR
jgi:hypothetical protein